MSGVRTDYLPHKGDVALRQVLQVVRDVIDAKEG